jgi:phosphate transport system permease protein
VSPTVPTPAAARPVSLARPRRRKPPRPGLGLDPGEPWIWLASGALLVALAMIVGLIACVVSLGGATFWPAPIEEVHLRDDTVLLGEFGRRETFRTGSDATSATAERGLLRIGNRELTGVPFRWIPESEIASRSAPPWAVVVERLAWGRFYGLPRAFAIDGQVVADGPEASWRAFREHHDESRARAAAIHDLEQGEIGRIHRELEEARLALREAELESGRDSPAWRAADERHRAVEAGTEREFARLQQEIADLRREDGRYEWLLTTSDGSEKALAIGEVVRAVPANQLGVAGKLGVYLDRWWEFLSADPRDANTEGGVFPAIVGTVVMTLCMSVLVVPFGALAALYLREYAKQGAIISMVRIAVNNLAGVPSIVFGVFGVGFFCYTVGVSIDELFYSSNLPNPTFGKGGVLWASLTLALLTLPVVIVATEEALAAVPNSMREGSYACGATKWQTLRRIVLPRAAPGILTGMILAIARGAGEVAPLMLVGAAKDALALPVDATAPFVHPSRSFMHLGYHLFDLGFHSPDSEAAKPMVFTTTLLLIGIVVVLNGLAIAIRSRLRRKFLAVHV